MPLSSAPGSGWGVFVALFVAIIAALLPALVILARHGRAGRKMGIPFAPFLALGGVIALFAGDALLDWYLDIGDVTGVRPGRC